MVRQVLLCIDASIGDIRTEWFVNVSHKSHWLHPAAIGCAFGPPENNTTPRIDWNGRRFASVIFVLFLGMLQIHETKPMTYVFMDLSV